LCAWNALIVSVSVLYLTGVLIKSAVIAAFVLISSLLGFGQRWLARGGFAIAVLAIAVSLGAIPHPSQWGDLFRDLRALLEYRINGVSPTKAAPERTVKSDQFAGSEEARRW
jgi:hypothetical protein